MSRNRKSAARQSAWKPGSRNELQGKPHRPSPFQFQKPLFQRQPSAVSRQLAAGTDDAMAWHDNRNRITAIGRSHRPYGFWPPDCTRYVGVASGLSVGNSLEFAPNILLEFGA